MITDFQNYKDQVARQNANLAAASNNDHKRYWQYKIEYSNIKFVPNFAFENTVFHFHFRKDCNDTLKAVKQWIQKELEKDPKLKVINPNPSINRIESFSFQLSKYGWKGQTCKFYR